ncbi:MAG: M15 family metallopeptidase [Firmicutes bacterium]|nr:M15 family metallopeptidase [Bacillota bacterium]
MGRPTLNVLVAVLALLVLIGLVLLVVPYAGNSVGEQQEEAESGISTELESQPRKETLQSDASRQASSGISEENSQTADRSSEYLILVNKTHGIGKTHKPKDLKAAKPAASDRPEEYQKLRKAAARAFYRLSKGAKKKDCVIKLTTGFRPYDYQKTLYKQYIQADGKKRAEQYSAKPGYSEHQSGLSADVSSPSVDYELTRSYGKTKEGKWLAKNAHKYGFIIRYPKGREDITGYEYEPWHIRYVGTDAAKEIYEQGITLEEYLGDI